ncbi:Mak31p PWA37_001961 [Arxiozyma heterogenica]|uniref:Mak31p n=1 Tax=Arxiozyma heterogenica TaxID=278026 RepID=UPI002F0726EF
MVVISSLRDIIGSTLYVNVTYDQHIMLTGKLQAIDAQGNLLLDDVKEITTGNSSDIGGSNGSGAKIRMVHQRMLGLVSVPRDSIISVKIDKTLFERKQVQKSDIINNVI